MRGLLILAGLLAVAPLLAKDTPPASTDNAPLVPRPHRDWDVPEAAGAISLRPVLDAADEEPGFLKQVDYLRRHNDLAMAIGYLREVAVNPDLVPLDRAKAVLVLADCLDQADRKAEALCWLKIWMQAFPSRPEVGAVAFRIGMLYTRLGLPDLARDSFYQSLSTTINQAQVQNSDDLRLYSRLTTATLWALAANEYLAGQYARAAELFDRYRREATTASPTSLEMAEFLRADCDYQAGRHEAARADYEQVLQRHPFNPLAPESRLRLYHLDVLKGKNAEAAGELEALIWTVRTVRPREEAYWQRRTAEVLLALNRKNLASLPPLLEKSTRVAAQGKTWQKELDHYDRLARLQMPTSPSAPAAPRPATVEEADLRAMQRSIDGLKPSPAVAKTP